MKHLRNTLLLVVVLLAGACSGLRLDRAMRAGRQDWTTEGGAPSRANVTGERIRTPMAAVWQYNAQAGMKGGPLVRDSVMIVGTLNGELQAVNLSNGKRLGYKNFGGSITGTPVLDGTTVYLSISVEKDETLISFDLSTGKRVWEFAAGPIETSPLLIGKSLVVTNVNGTVYCVDKSSGEQLWKYEIKGEGAGKQIHSSPASNGTAIAFGSDDGTLTVLDRTNGTLLWKDDAGTGIFATPVFEDSLLVVGTLGGLIQAYAAATGSLRWTFDTHAPVYGGPSAGGGMIFAGSSNGILFGLDAATGNERWNFQTKSVINSSPLIAGDRVIVGSLDRILYVLNSTNGKEVWRFTADGRIKVSPVLWGDFLLVTSEDKFVTALRPEQPL